MKIVSMEINIYIPPKLVENSQNQQKAYELPSWTNCQDQSSQAKKNPNIKPKRKENNPNDAAKLDITMCLVWIKQKQAVNS